MVLAFWEGAITRTRAMGTMQEVELTVILLAVTLVVALLARRLRMPYTLVLVIVGLLIGLAPFIANVQLDPDVVLFLFLPALLFEGAWNVEIERLAAEWLPIFLLAVPGLLISIAVMAVILHFGIGLAWLLAILVGAIVSPTDPIAALALLKRLHVSERLTAVIEGESLFNDGVGAAVFEIALIILLPSLGAAAVTGDFGHIPVVKLELEFLWLLLGGPLLGLAIGWSVAQLLRLVDDHMIETTVTFSVAYGAYLIGTELHTSGLLTVVGAGLVIGSYGRHQSMSERAREAAQGVWEFIAYLANSLLFLLLGIQIGTSGFFRTIPAIAWAVLAIVIGRFLMVYTLIPLQDLLARRCAGWFARRSYLYQPRPLLPSWRPLIVFTGLRGALSIALVLSLPTRFVQRNLLENIVYGVVLVTLVGQGLGLRFLLPHWPVTEESKPDI